MIIGFTGRLQTGKTTAANVLVSEFGFQKMSFADPIRSVMEDVNPLVCFCGCDTHYRDAVSRGTYDGAKREFPEIRRLMQGIGVAMREHAGPDVWVDALVRRLLATYVEALEVMDEDANVVIDDVRFVNEESMIRDLGGSVFRVSRPGLPQSSHVSETEGESIQALYEFLNTGSREEFERSIRSYFESFLGVIE